MDNNPIDTDWGKVWSQEFGTPTEINRRRFSVDFWDKMAPRYFRSIERGREEAETFAKWLVDTFELGPEGSLLEIGPGPGTYTVPLAKLLRKVTAVEPSKGMVEYLHIHSQREKVHNIRVIRKRWEEVSPQEVEAHDVVFAAYSLLVPDIREALSKMHTLAKKGVCIKVSAGKPGWATIYDRLYKAIYGRGYRPFPVFIVLYNVLYQMGIYANVIISKRTVVKEYETVEEAVDDWALRVRTSNREKVREVLVGILKKERGVLTLSYVHTDATIWWKKEV